MMSVLLAILATERDYPLLVRHWPYFKRTGFTILGCGTDDGQTRWPEPVMRLDTGKMGTKMTPAGSSIFGLVEQELDIWRWFLDQPEFDSVCVVEADNLFVADPPKAHPGDGSYHVTVLPNRAPAGFFSTPIYFSTPRWADRACAGLLYVFGMRMFLMEDVEHYMSDRFPALICQEHGIPFTPNKAWSPSTEAWSEDIWLQEAKAAIRGGAYCLHSVKTESQLNSLKPFFE